MTLLGLQRRLREVGRIRIGQQMVTKTGRKRPVKLDRFRLTSRDRHTIEQASIAWGGDVAPWDSPDGPQWEVITTSSELPVVVPPGEMSFSQHYELWTAGGCKRRCDGRWDVIRDLACDCDPSERECKIHTRLSVILPDLPALGVWRLDTQGYYAAVELAGAVDICQQAAAAGRYLPARLGLEQRSVQRVDSDGKPITLRFAVPVLNVDVAMTALVGAGAEAAGSLGDRKATAAPAPVEKSTWKPVGELAPGPFVSVADQMAEAERPRAEPKRANGVEPIKPTGLEPGTDANEKVCGICREPYGTQRMVRNTAPGPRFVHADCLPSEEPAEDSPPVGDGGGTSDGLPLRAVEPAPVASQRQPTVGQLKKLHALSHEVFEVSADLSGDQADELRKGMVLDLCAWLGQPGLTSRAEISRDTATKVIDALQGIQAGAYIWDGGLYDAERGTEVQL